MPFPADLEADVRAAYDALVEESTSAGADAPSFAVRSSATAEDLPDASFAGQQETFLNVRGIDAVLQAIREVYASLYNDRAIAYRVHHDFAHDAVGISAGVQRMVRSDIGSSGVMFTMDTESGFTDAVFITSAFGLGEGVVQGAVNPDEFYVYKPALRAGRPAVLKRSVGGKATKMVYTQDTAVGRTTEFIDVEPAAEPPAQPHRRRGHRARAARADHRGALRAPDGHRVGQGRRRRPALRAPGAPRDGAVAAYRRAGALHHGTGRDEGRRGARRGPCDRPEDRLGRRAGAHDHRPDARVRARRGAGRRHDRPRLGADHEARLGDRHQPRRTHLPRRDHRPRARHPRRRRHRQRHPRAGRRPRGHGHLRRGRHRRGLRGAARLQRRAHRARRAARDPRQDHDERRHPRAGLRLLAAAEQGRGPGPAGVHHQPPDRHPPPCAARAAGRPGRAAGRPARRDRGHDRGVPLTARLLRAARRRGRGHHRCRLRAAPGDRADERLQVQRVRQPRRRRALRARRGEPDDRLPRRVAVPLGGLRRVLRHGVRGAALRARRDGPDQRAG